MQTLHPVLGPFGQNCLSVLLCWDETYLGNHSGLQSIQGRELSDPEWSLDTVKQPKVTR